MEIKVSYGHTIHNILLLPFLFDSIATNICHTVYHVLYKNIVWTSIGLLS